MAKDLLLEIGMEEVPARFVRGAMDQLSGKLSQWLDESRIDHGGIEAFGTPRRIAVLVRQAAERQRDLQEEVRGPSRKIALDAQGGWTRAAQGFARGQGVETDALFFKDAGGAEYVFAAKNSHGAETAGLLPQALVAIIASMSFPKNMRWGSEELRFVRPIRWLAALFGSDVVPFEIAGVASGRTTYGHRFLGGAVSLSEAGSYKEALRRGQVIADPAERQAMIERQIADLAGEKGWHIEVPEDLLEEVLFLVELPTTLYGGFEPDYLSIPQEVLITSMREHQRYFPVLDGDGKLLPHFVTVRNGDSRNLAVIAKGNEKVLRARLSDAHFFYREDQKHTIAESLAKLETIVFHEELGTLAEKVRRIGQISRELGHLLSLEDAKLQDVERAAGICKFDLVTQMVYEFPELQGIMGQDYALKQGEKPEVAAAVFEHYRPRFSGDGAPSTLTGAIVGVADKIDTIAGCFSIGIIPTGSADPYALRRQAAGIVQIMLERGWPIKLSQLFELALSAHEARGEKRGREEILRDLQDFFALRVKNVMSDALRYDVVDAVMSSGCDDVSATVRKGNILMEQLKDPAMKTTVESFNRVVNLAAKAGDVRLDAAAFQEPVEHALHLAWQKVHAAYGEAMALGDEARALAVLGNLKQPITEYFDQVMVMAEDPRVRAARLALLKLIADDIRQFADFQKLVW